MQYNKIAMMLDLIVLMAALTISAQNVSYVKPNESSTHDCPHGQPCLTLYQYSQQAMIYFTTGATFLFLSGNHSLQTTLELRNISNITLRGIDDEHSAKIMYANEGNIKFVNVINLNIVGLTFTNYSYSDDNLFALKFGISRVRIYKSKFLGRSDDKFSRAIGSAWSDLQIINCLFEGNTGSFGGAMVYQESNITLSGNVFVKNRAMFRGGAIYAIDNSMIIFVQETLGNTFIDNSAVEYGGALHCESSTILTRDNQIALRNLTATPTSESATRAHNIMLYFSNNSAQYGGGISCLFQSTVSMSGALTILFANNSAEFGGAIYAMQSSRVILKSKYLNFTDNKAHNGGAIYLYSSEFIFGVRMNHFGYFSRNSGVDSGGAIYCQNAILKIAGSGYFMDNRAVSFGGGALHIISGSTLIITGKAFFMHNQAGIFGGAIFLNNSRVIFNSVIVEFSKNDADTGGGICSYHSQLNTRTNEHLNFIANTARSQGGGIWCYKTILKLRFANFINNRATQMGSAILSNEGNVTLESIIVTGNVVDALSILFSNLTVCGTSMVDNNIGGILSVRSFISLSDNTRFFGNRRYLGGAIYGLYSHFTVSGVTLFKHNTATSEGGAFFTIGGTVTLKGAVTFTSNTAQRGGAIYFQDETSLILRPGTNLSTSHNHATKYGGAIHKRDSITLIQCSFDGNNTNLISFLPQCFLQIDEIANSIISVSINSYNDSAGIDGSFLYGGQLSRCWMTPERIVPYTLLRKRVINIESPGNTNEAITSEPYQLCFCENNEELDCSGVKNVQTQRGQKFNITLIAFAQGGALTQAQVTAIVSPTGLQISQRTQNLPPYCTNVSYNFYSTEKNEELVLYPNGPCGDTGLASVNISVTLLPCPDGFFQFNEQCVCEKRLKVYNPECIIDESIYFERKSGSKFWMSALYSNKTYQGLILYKTCPAEYCKTETVKLTLDNLDVQCDLNRSGVLCGACRTNHSLLLGSSQCEECPDEYLALLLLFTAAGIILVAFLSILRLTVATGMINSLILYGNIVQANRNLFLPLNASNVLSVFIAWLNLDFGFKMCFFDGMTAYAQVWLQFAFPIYIWILISLIIFISRYSTTVSKLIGHNPIAVLATLLLMSYTKILKIIVEVYSSVELDYPDEKRVLVWLKDANVPYLQSRHLALTVVTTLILVFLFLPYTLFLLLGYKLYRFSGRKYFRWFNRLKPLLDSYYAPYKKNTRYWTGFLLLVRCVLYIVFSFNSLEATDKSLIAINTVFTALVITAWLSASIYKTFTLNIIEASVYLNIITLSTTTLADANSAGVVYSLVGIVFATMVWIIVYHFHIAYTAKLPIWVKFRTTIIEGIKNLTARKAHLPPPVADASSQDPHKIISKTVIDLREPLLDN